MSKLWQRIVLSMICMLSVSTASATTAALDTWDVDTAHSTVSFRVDHIVGTVPGMFTEISGQVDTHAYTLTHGQIYLLIDAASVFTGTPKRDEHLRSPEFLDVDRAPKIIFASRSIEQVGEDLYTVTGDLTIRDVTNEVRVPVHFLGMRQHPLVEQMPHTQVMGLRAEFTINRLDFEIGSPKWTQMGMMGATIDLVVDLEVLSSSTHPPGAP